MEFKIINIKMEAGAIFVCVSLSLLGCGVTESPLTCGEHLANNVYSLSWR